MSLKRSNIAIDFGSKKVVTAYLQDNVMANIITDEEANRTIQNCIAFTEHCSMFGFAADYQSSMNPKNTIRGGDLKLLLTQNKLDNLYPFSLESTDTINPIFVCNYKNQETRVHLVQLIAMILSKVKENAERFLESQVNQCTITVPSCYENKHRRLMQNAAMIAGFDKVHLISDTTAAALTYAIEKNSIEKDHMIMIIDIGETSTEASIIQVDKLSIVVRKSKAAMKLGGSNFVSQLVNYFVDDFKTKTNINLMEDININFLMRLYNGCEELKRRLSAVEHAKVTLEVFYNGEPYDLEMDRVKFEELCKDIFENIKNIWDNLFDDEIKKNEIEKVILVGGGTRIPKLQQDLMTFMNRNELSRILNQDEANAIGAAYSLCDSVQITDIHEYTKDFDNDLNIENMRQFLDKVNDDDKAFIEYKSEINNLEALCYNLKRKVKKKEFSESEEEVTIKSCTLTDTLKWIRNANKNQTTIEEIRQKSIELNKLFSSEQDHPVMTSNEDLTISKKNENLGSKEQKQEYKVMTTNKESLMPKANENVDTKEQKQEHQGITINEDSSIPKVDENVDPIKQKRGNAIIKNSKMLSSNENNELTEIIIGDAKQDTGVIDSNKHGSDQVEEKSQPSVQKLTVPKSGVVLSEKNVKKNVNYYERLYNDSVDFYKNKEYHKAVEVLTKLINCEKSKKHIGDQKLFSYRGTAYFKLKEYQLCLDDLDKVDKNNYLTDFYTKAENINYKEKAQLALTRFEKDGDVAMITEALSNRPKNPTRNSEILTLQLYYRRSLLNLSSKNYGDSINDMYETVKMLNQPLYPEDQKSQILSELTQKLKKHNLQKYMADNDETKRKIKFLEQHLNVSLTSNKKWWCVIL